MGCLDDDTALALARGTLAGDALEAAIVHIDGCSACRLSVAAAATSKAEEPAADDAKVMGRFELDGVAGAGAMGIVYRARDPRLGRTVALKVIRPEALAPATRARFEREARALARVSHPNVVAVHEVGDSDGALHLAMEHLPGGTLGDWLRAAPRTAREIVDKLVQAGEGLLAAHHAGLVHRDFKPSNVLLDGAGRVRVTDFGLAHDGTELDRGGADRDRDRDRSEDRERDGNRLEGDVLRTRTGMVIGTPAYMAPEQHEGRVADPRADQFAFAVTLYEALAGHRPFSAGNQAELAAAVRGGTIEVPRRPIARPLWRAIRRALAPRPEDRFPSMREMLDELGAWQRGSRGRWLVAGVVAATLAAVALAAVLGWRVWREDAASATNGDGAEWKEAEAWMEKARAFRRRDDASASVDASHRAMAAAQVAGHHAIAREAAENAAWMYLFGLRDVTQAARWVGVAEQLDGSAPPSARERALRDVVRAHVDEAADLEGAIARLEHVVGRIDGEPAVRALEGLALMMMRARRWDDAKAWLARLEREHPDDRRARFVVARQRASLAMFEQRHGDAAPLLERAAGLAPGARERAGALVALGEALANLGQLDGDDGALARFDQGAAADPEGHDGPVAIDALCGRARALDRARRDEAALPPMTRCLEAREARLSARAPVVIFTMVELGTLHDRLGRRELAIDYLTRALDRFAAIGRDDAAVQAVRDRLARLKQDP